jgi:hypothetical protein
MRHLLGFLVLAAVVSGCAGQSAISTTTLAETTTTEATTTTSTTTTTIPTTTTLSAEELAAAQHESDVQKIKGLWRAWSDIWFSGYDTAIQYAVEHNYPGEGCTAEDFESSTFADLPEGYGEEAIVDESTIEGDDGWQIPGGQAAGSVPEGRVYIMSVTFTYSAPDYESSTETEEVHATVVGDNTYFFFDCGRGT